MAILLKTKHTVRILDDIKKKIDAHEIDTWSYDSDNDFTHCVQQWEKKAWIRPKVEIEKSQIVFYMIGRKGVVMSKDIYSVYQGRFLEMLLKNYANEVDAIEILLPLRNEYDVKNVDY